mgnify:FL=1
MTKFSVTPGRIQLAYSLSAGVIGFLFCLNVFHSLVLGFCFALVVSAATRQFVSSRQNARQVANSRLIPDLTEIFAAGLEAGLSLLECAEELTRHSNQRLVTLGQQISAALDSNLALPEKLQRCSSLVACREAGLLFQMLETAAVFGDRGLRDALLGFAKRTRELHALEDELQSRLGWIRGTATLAQFSPWIVVALLSLRPEAAAAYANGTGALLLVAGLIATQLAAHLIALASKRSSVTEVFSVGGIPEFRRAS